MKKHVKIYLDYFGYGVDDVIICENPECRKRAVDIAHIIARSKFGKKNKENQDVISNLIAFCRDCHYDYDFNNKWNADEVREMHRRTLEGYSRIKW